MGVCPVFRFPNASRADWRTYCYLYVRQLHDCYFAPVPSYPTGFRDPGVRVSGRQGYTNAGISRHCGMLSYWAWGLFVVGK